MVPLAFPTATEADVTPLPEIRSQPGNYNKRAISALLVLLKVLKHVVIMKFTAFTKESTLALTRFDFSSRNSYVAEFYNVTDCISSSG